MKIAILGTRGVPNHHGGFEQFAEYFSVFLKQKGHEVYVYNSFLHPYKEKTYKGVNIIHCQDPENKIGTVGQFIYDLNCILDSRKRKFDIILQLGYTSSSIWYFLLPKRTIIVTNMDGLEWKRSKYSKTVQKFLKFAEKLAVKHSDYLVSDSLGIKNYLEKTYQKKSEFIAYGAEVFSESRQGVIEKYDLLPYGYHLLIARMEPENNIEIVIKGIINSNGSIPLVIIGNYEATNFGKYLYRTYKNFEKIRFFGQIYDMEKLNNLRYYSNLYFHGHSVGGTNPSLLEAMASDCLIIANDNIFNKSVLGVNAYYFSDYKGVIEAVNKYNKKDCLDMIKKNKEEIEKEYTWEVINNRYLNFLNQCLNS